jgi:hypothetical protein
LGIRSVWVKWFRVPSSELIALRFFPLPLISLVNVTGKSTSEPLNPEPFNPPLRLQTEHFIQNITPKSVDIYEVCIKEDIAGRAIRRRHI